MSGHSKWSTIKRKKEIRDKARGNVFTKMANNIVVAVKKGGGDPESNFSLRLAIDKAKSTNMPNDNIKRAIDRGMGKVEDGKELKEIVIEGYGPGGIPVVVEIVSDNRNRIVSELGVLFDKNGGSLAEPGAVLYQFDRVGRVAYEGSVDDDLFLEMIDLGAQDIDQENEGGVIDCSLGGIVKIVKMLMDKGYVGVDGDAIYKPKHLDEKADAEKVEAFLDKLRELDDVQEVYSNVEV